ncbi:hypothetical protein DL771_002534 [Monosporascus sp. 5C6A]|nr:hypothetical protein DL771_002534 [Monosporascus sp. 5C6A]
MREVAVLDLPLPHDFVSGAATAAYQVEGAASQDGRGPSIWDAFSHLQPSCIKTVATLCHCDLHPELQTRYGGMLNTAEFQADFVNYAGLCFARFGDRVKQWIIFNEPYIISTYGFIAGIILSHTAAVQAYATDFLRIQAGSISIVMNGGYYEPYDIGSIADRAAAHRTVEFYIGWFGDPIYFGADQPSCMRTQLGTRLPEFPVGERNLIRRTAPVNSFYGMNHYTSQYARARTTDPDEDDLTGNAEEPPVSSNGVEIGALSGVPRLRVIHSQFRKLLNWLWARYQRPV